MEKKQFETQQKFNKEKNFYNRTDTKYFVTGDKNLSLVEKLS